MKNIFKAVLLTGAALGLVGSANAAITIYTTQASFLAASTDVQTDTFNDLAQQRYSSPLSRSAGTIGYQVNAATGGLYPGSVSGDPFMSTEDARDPMTFSSFSSPIAAIGARFFSSSKAGEFTPSAQITVSATDNEGTTVEVILNPTTTSFRGFTSTGYFTSMTVNSFNQPSALEFIWPSVDDIQLGTAAVPEPATWAMMIGGFGMIGGSMRSARRRQKTSVSYV